MGKRKLSKSNVFYLFSSCVEAGFPSPADDYLEKELNLNELLIKNPNATYFVRVKGDSMIGAGIFEGSILLVDRMLNIRNGHICVARVGDEFTVKRFFDLGTHIELRPENPKYQTIKIEKEEDSQEFEIQGVVRSIITETV